MNNLLEHFGTSVALDALNFFVGDKLNTGQYRTVYAFPMNPSYVLKVELGAQCFSNVVEWDIWNNFRYSRWGKWLCPVVNISPSGALLLMERAEPIKKLPNRVPSFFADLKLENWGMLNGRPVCIDYGNHSIFELAKHHAALSMHKDGRISRKA